ncbi:glycoside hydrolase family 28 protein [Flectobacillus major]|jgi:polygalacturonase|uniref:glycoside hydrolase family 28 protein n=1 Tax=Flectobacillus major TaxID=103 RepID=UPI0003FE2CA2|nr:glycoside hydrolase family 28 protein [Flectobacillus major]
MQLMLVSIISFLSFFSNVSSDTQNWTKKVGAKNFPKSKKVIWVNKFGVANDGSEVCTKAIQQAIDICAQQGGGIVRFEKGVYLSGSLFIKSGVNLEIAAGVELRGSTDLNDYPEIDTRVAGIEMKWPAALINILGQKNAAITGKGLVNAQGKIFWDKYWSMRKDYEKKNLRWIVDYDCKRPRTVLIANASDISIKDITLQEAGFWTVHILYSTHITADGIIIRNNVNGHGPSTDGIDIDSSSWVLVQHCDIDCNDDNFCLKSGRDADGLRVNRVTEYVLIQQCISRAGGGLITLGSETSGGIRHILARNLSAEGTGVGIRLKSATTRGGVIEDIHFEQIKMTKVGTAIEVTMNWNPSYSYSTLPEGYQWETLPAHWKTMLTKVEPASLGIPIFKNIYLSNIEVVGAKKGISASGLKESILQNFDLQHIHIAAQYAGNIEYASNWKGKDIAIFTQNQSSIAVSNSQHIDFDN